MTLLQWNETDKCVALVTDLDQSTSTRTQHNLAYKSRDSPDFFLLLRKFYNHLRLWESYLFSFYLRIKCDTGGWFTASSCSGNEHPAQSTSDLWISQKIAAAGHIGTESHSLINNCINNSYCSCIPVILYYDTDEISATMTVFFKNEHKNSFTQCFLFLFLFFKVKFKVYFGFSRSH